MRLRSSLALALCAALASSTAAARPRLGVLVVFDQMPLWLLERSEPFFGAGGFGGLAGAHYAADYPYAGTETAPGHATLATCAAPAVHGIATNTWFHEGKPQYVTDDDAFPLLAPTADDPTAKLTRGSSPRMLLVPTLGDAMKTSSRGKAKVITVSHKDRSAILTGGRSADLAIFYDRELGRYTTSTAYADALPPWLVDAGTALPQKAFAEGTWDIVPAPAALQALVPEDERPGEGALKGFGPTFPHHLKDIADDKTKKSAYRATPQSIDDLFALALLAVENVGLGADLEPDLLVVSVSTTDVIGHNYGAESLEQQQTLRHADVALRRFVAGLKSRVSGDVVIAISSDHGAPPLPQTIGRAGFDVPVVTYEAVAAAADAALKKVAPKSDGSSRVQGFFPPQLFVDFKDVKDVDSVIAAVSAAVEGIAGIAAVYDMRPGQPERDQFHSFMRNSAPPGRAAQIFVRQEPRVVLVEEKFLGQGTDHGSVYMYDRRVPFILSGPGVRRGRFPMPVDTRDIPASLAFALSVPPPDACQGHAVSALAP